LLGRFLSPNPYVQLPDIVRSYNRYSLDIGVTTTIAVSYANGINPVTGRSFMAQSSDFFEGTKYSDKVLGQMENI
jgi:hypothetical protein